MKRLLSTMAFLALTTAQAAPVTVNLNGQAVSLNTTTISGVNYIKTADLQKALAGVGTASGGANQKASVEGCMNEWLFNGIVRMRVTDVTPITGNSNGYAVKVEFRNGSNETYQLNDVGIEYNNAIMLTFPDGDSWAHDEHDGAWQSKTSQKMMQGTGGVYTFGIFPRQAVTTLPKPQKFLMEVKNKYGWYIKSRFIVPDPSFRVNLTCKK